MKRMSKGPARRIRLRAVVAYPAISVALVVSVALVLTPFGPAQGMALAATATATPPETVVATADTPDARAHDNRAHDRCHDRSHDGRPHADPRFDLLPNRDLGPRPGSQSGPWPRPQPDPSTRRWPG